MPEKNSLTAADARRVEKSFQTRLMGFAAGADLPKAGKEAKESKRSAPNGRTAKSARRKNRKLPDGIDKAVLTFPEPRRVRDRDHVKSVAQHPCLVCGRKPTDAHHLRFAQSRALGRKVSDEFTVPLCRGHHREAHRCGDETAWWSKAGVDPTLTARTLWLKTHPLPTVPDRISRDDNEGSAARSPHRAKRGQPVSKRGANDKTNPIVAVAGR